MEQSWQQNNEYECMKYSVLMPVYHKENPAYFYQAAASMMNQTIPPDEFVLVCDGPLTPVLDETIQTIDREWPGVLQVLRLPVCGGIARALAAGVEACRNEWIARMDSDDIACPDRCEKQLKRYADEAAGKLLGKKAEQGKLGLLSGKIAEFAAAEVPEQENVDNLNAPDRGEIGSGMNGKLFPPGRITGIRSLPCQYKEILTFARKRNPMNHMAVMMRRSAVLAVGNYHPVPGAEDYELWVRLLQAGYKAENLSDILVYARTDNGMIKRRGGLSYARAALNLQKTFFKSGFLNRREYLRNCVIRVTASLIPASVRGILYQKKLRGTLSRMLSVPIKRNRQITWNRITRWVLWSSA